VLFLSRVIGEDFMFETRSFQPFFEILRLWKGSEVSFKDGNFEKL